MSEATCEELAEGYRSERNIMQDQLIEANKQLANAGRNILDAIDRYQELLKYSYALEAALGQEGVERVQERMK